MKTIVKRYEFNNAIFNLDLIELRLMNLMISQLDSKNGENFNEIKKIHISDYQRIFEKRLAKLRAEENIKKLTENRIKIKTDDGEITANFLTFAKYKDGYIEYKINPFFKKYLIVKSHFIKYNIKNISKLTSKYSIRLYELIKQYHRIGKREFQLNELYNILGVSKTLRDYRNFKNRVLKKAIEEINESGLKIEVEEIKRGRKVDRLVFRMKSNRKTRKVIDCSKLTKEQLEALKNLNICI